MVDRLRQAVLLLALCISWALVADATAQTSPFPAGKPITFVVPTAPGGPTDTMMRAIATKMSENVAQTIIVENKSGAGGIIAAQHVSRAPADGYTVLSVYMSHAVNLHIQPNLPYDTLAAFAPVMLVAKGPLVLVVNSKVPAKNVAELVAYGKANPGKLNFAASALGGASHLGGELFKRMSGIDMQIVPYKGTSATLPDMLAGRVDITLDSYQIYSPHAKTGAVRLIGVSSERRIDLDPNLPAVAETLPGYEAAAWYGVLVPAGTPADIVERLHREFTRALADETVRSRIKGLGFVPGGGTSSEFAAFIRSEIKKWESVVANAGLKQK